MRSEWRIGVLALSLCQIGATCNAPKSPPGPLPPALSWAVTDLTNNSSVPIVGGKVVLYGYLKYLITLRAQAPDGVTTVTAGGTGTYLCGGTTTYAPHVQGGFICTDPHTYPLTLGPETSTPNTPQQLQNALITFSPGELCQPFQCHEPPQLIKPAIASHLTVNLTGSATNAGQQTAQAQLTLTIP